MPPIGTVELVRIGFCEVDVKPRGPLQAYVAPATEVENNLIVSPAQTGVLLLNDGADGAAGSVKVTAVLNEAEGQPAAVTTKLL